MNNNQSAMRQLLNQLRDERNTLPMDIEWNRCYQAIESVIESKYIDIEKNQIIEAYYKPLSNEYWNKGEQWLNDESEIYYTSTYGQ